VFGAIIVVGERDPADFGAVRTASSTPMLGAAPLACVEVLGRSILEAMIENLRAAGVGPISVLRGWSTANVDAWYRSSRTAISGPGGVEFCCVEDLSVAVGLKLQEQKESGTEATLLMPLGPYVELDAGDLFQFHRAQRQSATPLVDADGSLDMWLVETARFASAPDVVASLSALQAGSYEVSGYVNRLDHPRQLRRLTADALTSKCGLRPLGQEVRPGVWYGDGAHIRRGARVLAPAFIGRDSVICDDCEIADCSSIERDCEVDYASAVSDASLLPNSYVGIGLELRNSIVNGNSLLSLEHDVTLEIKDPFVIRQNKALGNEVNRPSPAEIEVPGMLFNPAEEAAN
jgi:NDP-sugar pyrophosphorylase family protein